MNGSQRKVALVTGASTGIGRAVALAFAQSGFDVVVADVDRDRGETVAKEVEALGASGFFVETDVSDRAAVERLVAATVERFGGLDVACNNAGIEGTPMPTADCTDENWDRTIAVNLTGVFLCMRAEIPRMLERDGGAIVNVSSVAGLVGFENIPAYTASKHGVVGLTKTAALEYATHGIRVNAVCPGVIDTEMVERFTHGDPEAAAQLTSSEPVGRMGSPEEIAASVVWLCSDAASFVTGQAIAVDGGFVAR
ncbi:MAG TPA: SDR family oxidoreductase [Acidimicrobiia bacterium]|nr:SDR family oxidoreductase [Acidimicrobiia bacterium]